MGRGLGVGPNGRDVLRFYIVGTIGFLAVVHGHRGGDRWSGWWVLLARGAAALLSSVSTTSPRSGTRSCATTRSSGHFRFLLEDIRPELQQYFIERNCDGRPFDRDIRSSIYQRAKGLKDEQPFGTERDVDEPGYEYLVHSTAPVDAPDEPRGCASAARTAPSPTTWRC